ncbi:MAG: beta-N-acetylhexosaminidase [Armatimonadetes bacterium]|nr:beta-N-acetylhexosaminidase [Armatimonadota bacterium]
MLVLAAAAAIGAISMSEPDIAIVPKPVSLKRMAGSFHLTRSTKFNIPGGHDALVQASRALLDSTTSDSAEKASGEIYLNLDAKSPLGPEGYQLLVGPKKIEINAASDAGLFYALQSLRMMAGPKSPIQEIPGVAIEDKPRFPWRGMHLDCCRHFMPKSFILKFIDALALHKMNSFHWHLTDDQGWRIEIKKYPKLTEVGSKRKRTMLTYSPPTFDETPHGGYYTQDDIREVVAYAQARFINVVPEIEMPGHATAAIAAYPELGMGTPVDVLCEWGVTSAVFNTEDTTVKFLQDVLDEVLTLFPSKYIHVGGDECPKEQWKADPRSQAKIKNLGLKDEHELQSWFIRQMDKYLTSKGRRLIGWDEILEGGLAENAVVMSWRGIDGGIEAAKQKHDVVMTPTGWTYFDYYQSKDLSREPHGIGGYVPLQKVYEFEPIPDVLSTDESKHILGAQGQLWTEYIRDQNHVSYMAFPRACALAEILWTPKEKTDYSDFRARLRNGLELLKEMGLKYRDPDIP